MNRSEDFVISDTDNRSEGNDNDKTAQWQWMTQTS
jgi:hypothetical protein